MQHGHRSQRRVGRVCAGLTAAGAVCLAACGGPSELRVAAMPLGLGSEMRLGVKGAVNDAPAVAARWPFAVVAWAAATPAGSAVYVATSVDNGASFSAPRRVDAAAAQTADAASLAPRVVLGWPKVDAHNAPVAPAIHVVWRAGTETDRHLRAVQSTDGGQSFVDEAMDGERPVDAPLQSGKTPSLEQVSRAVADARPEHPHGAYDECGTLLVVWAAGEAGAPRVVMRRLIEGPSGAQQTLRTVPVSDAPAGDRPDVASLFGGVLVAWSSPPTQESIVLRRIGLESVCQARPPADLPRGTR